MVRRTSFGQVSAIEKLPGGAIRFRARVGRDGIQEYRMRDGRIRREYRSKETLQASAAGLKDMPIVVGHPGSELMTSQEWRALAHGHVSEVQPELEFDGTHHWAVVTAVVNDPVTARRVEAKELAETSMGQVVNELEFKGPGISPLGPYDVEQSPGVADHLSLEMPGHARAGSGCRILTDSLDEQKEGRNMDPELKELLARIGRLEAEVAQLKSERDAASAERDTVKAQLDAKEKELGEVKAERDASKAQLDSVDVDVIVNDELAFREGIAPHLPTGYKFESKTRKQVRLDSIKHLGGTLADTASDIEVQSYQQGLATRVVLDSKQVPASGTRTPDQIRAEKRAEALKARK